MAGGAFNDDTAGRFVRQVDTSPGLGFMVPVGAGIQSTILAGLYGGEGRAGVLGGVAFVEGPSHLVSMERGCVSLLGCLPCAWSKWLPGAS